MSNDKQMIRVLELRVDGLGVELARQRERYEVLCGELRSDVERLMQSSHHRPRRRQTKRRPLTSKQLCYLETRALCHGNNAEACGRLKIKPSSGQQHWRLIKKKAKRWGLTIDELAGGPAPSRATRFRQDRGQDEVPDRTGI